MRISRLHKNLRVGPRPSGRALTNVLIAVATYKRPGLLRELLDSLVAQTVSADTFSVIVVDNDANASAAQVVQDFDNSLQIEYAHEPTPGIAAARNRALAGDLSRFDWVAFVDDDETADPGWLKSLLSTAASTGASIVAGPVVTHLPPGSPWWVRRYKPYDLLDGEDQEPVRWAATNNSLISVDRLTRLEQPYFSEEFSMTGGSDAELFWRLGQTGSAIIFSSSAIVRETIPSSRTTFAWWWRRSVKQGNVSGRLMLRQHRPIVVAAIGIARILVGATLGTVSLVAPSTRTFVHLPKGVGTLNAIRGSYVLEYARARGATEVRPE
ncbi:glycosyltransferase [Nocardioides sp. BGMRC 2183]|nr:glycosyltransferase [Nocardioides sp. BGMRC 2183]